MLASPSATQDLWGHEAAEQTLLSLALSGRMPHGWIFTGPAGIGKATLAYRLARFLLYRGFSGGTHTDANEMDLFGEVPHAVAAPRDLSIPPESPTFAQVAAGSHPDLLIIAPEEETKDLNVEKIRAAGPFLYKTASQGGWRIVMVDGAERMNRAAQNALLKVLEEPSPNSLLILLTDHLGKLLPTIRSRSRLLRLYADNDMARRLETIDPRISALPAADRDTLWNMAGGAPGQMLQLLDQDALQALSHLTNYICAPNAARANELAQGFAYQPQFANAGRVLLWLCTQIATGQAMNLPPARIPALLKFHEDAQTMLAETTQLHLDGAACWHELLGRLPSNFVYA